MKLLLPIFIGLIAILLLGGCLESDPPIIFEDDRETIAGLADTWKMVQFGNEKNENMEGMYLKVSALPDKEYRFDVWQVDDDGFRGEALDLFSEWKIEKQLAYLNTGSSTYLLVIAQGRHKVRYLEVAVTRSYNPLHFREIETVTFKVLDVPSSGFNHDGPSFRSILQRRGFTVDRSGSEGSEPTYELKGNLTSTGLIDLFSDAAFDKFLEKKTMISFRKLGNGARIGRPRPTKEVASSGGAEVEKSANRSNDEYTKALEEKNRQLQEQLEAKRQAQLKLQEQVEANRQSELKRQQRAEYQRICGAWTCVKLKDGTVLFQTQDGSAWVYRNGRIAPKSIWPTR